LRWNEEIVLIKGVLIQTTFDDQKQQENMWLKNHVSTRMSDKQHENMWLKNHVSTRMSDKQILLRWNEEIVLIKCVLIQITFNDLFFLSIVLSSPLSCPFFSRPSRQIGQNVPNVNYTITIFLGLRANLGRQIMQCI
jgi:hypothetical protein